MSLRSPAEMKNGAYRRIVVKTPFPLMGKGRDRGASEPNRPSPLPLSFPVKGKGLGRWRRSVSHVASGHRLRF